MGIGRALYWTISLIKIFNASCIPNTGSEVLTIYMRIVKVGVSLAADSLIFDVVVLLNLYLLLIEI